MLGPGSEDGGMRAVASVASLPSWHRRRDALQPPRRSGNFFRQPLYGLSASTVPPVFSAISITIGRMVGPAKLWR